MRIKHLFYGRQPTMRKRDLDRYKEFYKTLCDYAVKHNGRLPPFRHSIVNGQYKSTSNVSYMYNGLVKLGWLDRNVERDGDREIVYFSIPGSRFYLPDKLPFSDESEEEQTEKQISFWNRFGFGNNKQRR